MRPGGPLFGSRFAALFFALSAIHVVGSDSLVPVEQVHPPCLQEIRYATKYNFTGQILYPLPRAFLHHDTARALRRVQRDLQKRGLGLKIWDAYRPLSVQQSMWNLIRDERYVSNPAVNKGRHTRGTAVDVTLVDRLGRELTMPSEFDDFSERAHRDYSGGTHEQRTNRQLLQNVMQRHGFVGYPTEWWHFDLKGWESYPPLDVPIETLAGTANIDDQRGQIEHLVFVWFKRPGSKMDRTAFLRATEKLRKATGLIESVRYGGPVPSRRAVVDDTFDIALLMRFKDRRSLDKFEKNPLHEQAIRDVLRPLASKVLIYDIALD